MGLFVIGDFVEGVDQTGFDRHIAEMVEVEEELPGENEAKENVHDQQLLLRGSFGVDPQIDENQDQGKQDVAEEIERIHPIVGEHHHRIDVRVNREGDDHEADDAKQHRDRREMVLELDD